MGFDYRDGVLHADGIPLEHIARRFGTPCYVYSRAEIERGYGAFADALSGRDAMVAYSVKANSNLAVLGLLARLGAGFDIVSGGELERVRASGGDMRKVLFSGVGKTAAEIRAALLADVLCVNLESSAEMDRVDAIARELGRQAPVAFRVNPDVDARTHPYIATGLRQNKFGIAYDDALAHYLEASRRPGLRVVGIGCHIGSQLIDPAPLEAATMRLVELVERLAQQGVTLSHIDIGGGFGIRYRDESPPPLATFLEGVLNALAGRAERLIVDPGRSVVGPAGVLLARVEYVKPGASKSFLVVDAAMNDLLRPALYDAWHDILPVRAPPPSAIAAVFDVVGPVCESGDFLARDRALAAQPGELLAIMCAGAYGMVMSSNYNSRPRAAEVLVDGGEAHLVRQRETIEHLLAQERVP